MVGEVIFEALVDVVGSAVGILPFYAPGFLLVRFATLGRYPPDFMADEGRWLCTGVGFGFWAALCGGLFALLM